MLCNPLESHPPACSVTGPSGRSWSIFFSFSFSPPLTPRCNKNTRYQPGDNKSSANFYLLTRRTFNLPARINSLCISLSPPAPLFLFPETILGEIPGSVHFILATYLESNWVRQLINLIAGKTFFILPERLLLYVQNKSRFSPQNGNQDKFPLKMALFKMSFLRSISIFYDFTCCKQHV